MTLSAETIPNHLLFESGDGSTLLVYGRPAPNKADHTQVRFWTDDMERDVRELEGRGATFEDYDFPTLKTVNHVATTAGSRKVSLAQGSGRQHAGPVPARIVGFGYVSERAGDAFTGCAKAHGRASLGSGDLPIQPTSTLSPVSVSSRIASGSGGAPSRSTSSYRPPSCA